MGGDIREKNFRGTKKGKNLIPFRPPNIVATVRSSFHKENSR